MPSFLMPQFDKIRLVAIQIQMEFEFEWATTHPYPPTCTPLYFAHNKRRVSLGHVHILESKKSYCMSPLPERKNFERGAGFGVSVVLWFQPRVRKVIL